MAERNGNGVPAWVKSVSVLVGAIGLPGFLLIWYMGAFTGVLPSPVDAAIRAHDERTTRVQRLICKGVWKESVAMQQECDR